MENKINTGFTIELNSILRDLKRNVIVIVMSVLIAFMGLYIAQQSVYTPEYTSSATLVVNSKVGNSVSYANLSVSSDMASVFSKVFVQPSMKSKAAKNLGLASFDGEISAKAVEKTNILQLSVTSRSPKLSYDLLCSVLEVYPQISEIVFDNAYIDVLKMPSLAHGPSNSMSKTNKLLVIVLSVALSAGAIVGLSILRDTVKTEEDFYKKIDSNLIGSVIHESKNMALREWFKRKKKALCINESSFLSLKFSESFFKIASKLEYAKRRNGDKVFAITSIAENEGKSTVAANIAIALASKGNKVILFDLDAKKPALYKIFEKDYNEKSELGNMLAGKINISDYRFRRYRKTNLYLALNTAPHSGYQKWIDNGSVKKVLESLKEKADFIIIDTAPISADSSVTDIIKIVDKTLVVVRTDIVHCETINDTLLTVNEVGGNLFGCVLNDVYPEFSLLGQNGFDESGYYGVKGYGKHGKYSSYGKYSAYDKYGKYESLAFETSELGDDKDSWLDFN